MEETAIGQPRRLKSSRIKSKYPNGISFPQRLRGPAKGRKFHNTKENMQMKQFKNKLFASVLCMVLIVAMALSMTACTNNVSDDAANTGSEVEQTVEQTVEQSFTFEVVDKDGNMTVFDITTDKATVGEALLEEGLIKGEDGQYGLYVTEVNGIVADYNIDQTYWAFYVDGAYASSGVDMTDVVDGATYSFKVEK
jgi:hypothetical protein